MTGPVVWWGDDMAAARRRARMRASDADREHVIDTLKAAYAYGLLTKNEFDARVGQTFCARTYGELALVTSDIPARLPAAPPPPARAPAAATAAHADPKTMRVDRAIVATALLAALAFFAALVAGNLTGGYLALGATASALVSLFMTGTRAFGARRGTGSGRQLPPPEAAKGLRADPATASDLPARQLPHPARPPRRGRADRAESGPLRPQVAS